MRLYLVYIKCRQKEEEYEMHQVLHVIKQCLFLVYCQHSWKQKEHEMMKRQCWVTGGFSEWGYALHEDAKWTSRHMTLKAMKCSSPSISLFFVLLLQCSGTSTVKGFLYLNPWRLIRWACLCCVLMNMDCRTSLQDSNIRFSYIHLGQSKMHVASVISHLQNKLGGGHYH